MGFLFQSVSQLAGFLMNETRVTSKKINSETEKPDGQNFQSILESMADNNPSACISDSEKGIDDVAYLESLLNANFATINNVNPKLDQRVEIKERAGISADLLSILVSNQKDTITLKLRGAAIAKLGTATSDISHFDFNNNMENNNIGASLNIKQLLQANLFGESLIKDSITNIELEVPSSVEAPDVVIPGSQVEKTVKVSDMLQALRDYPDPIDIEIGDLDDGIIASDSSGNGNTKLLSSSFKFDLRDLLKAVPQEKVQGILTTTEKSLNNIIYDKNITMPSTRENPAAQIDISEIQPTVLLNKNIGIPVNKEYSAIRIAFDEIKSPVLFDPGTPASSTGNREIANPLNAGKLPSADISDAKPLTESFISESSKPETNLPENKPQALELEAVIGNEKNQPRLILKGMSQKKPALVSEMAPNDKPILNSSAAFIDSLGDDINLIKESQSPVPSPAPQIDNYKAMNFRAIKNAIMDAFEKNSGYVKIKLHPDNLGEVNIRLLWKENGLTVHMKADNRESHKILTSGAAELKGSLESANFKVFEVNVSTQSDWDGKSHQNSGQQLAGEQKQSRHQRESSNNASGQKTNNWESQNSNDDSTSRQKTNSWVDLKA